jgi:hypothetical protein
MADTADSARLEKMCAELQRLNDGLARFTVAAEQFAQSFSSLTEEVRNIKAVPVFVELQEPADPTEQIVEGGTTTVGSTEPVAPQSNAWLKSRKKGR